MLAAVSRKLNEHFWLFIVFSFCVALAFPSWFVCLYPWLEYFLMTMIFCAFLKTDVEAVAARLKRPLGALRFALFKLVLVPAAIWYLSTPLPFAYRASLLLVAVVPQGVSSPTLLDLMGADIPLGFSYLLISYAAAPFTIPLVCGWCSGRELQLDYAHMTLVLLKMIFVPFVLSQVIRRLAPRAVTRFEGYASSVSVVMVVAVAMGSVSKEASLFKSNLSHVLGAVSLMYVLYVVMGVAGMLAAGPDDAAAATGLICSVFCNITLSVVLAGRFFPDDVLALTVLGTVPWNTLHGPAKYVVSAMLRKEEGGTD